MTSCLIIDDDKLLRQMASDILAAHGFEVREASCGREGLESFLAQTPDIVLLDLVLPDISGYDLLPQLAGTQNTSRVIVTTNHFSLDSALKVLREGAGDYLPKPFSEETLLMSVERVLKRQALEQENRELSLLLSQRIDDLSVLHRISQLITSGKPLEAWMDEVMRATSAYIGAQAGSLLLLDSSSDELFFYVSTGPKGQAVREVRLPRGEGIAWWCLIERQAVKVDDVRTDERFCNLVDAQTGFTTRNVLTVPVVVGDECIGVIELLNKVGRSVFSAEDLERVRELSSHIAVAVQNALVVRDLKHSREELSHWSRQLEQIVEERTRALKQANQARQIAYRDLEQSHRTLKQAQAILVGREKMAALGLLAAGVAHEINNPLSFVNANLDSLKQYVRSLRRLSGVVIHAKALADRERFDQVECILKEAGRVIEEEKLRDVLDDLGPLFDEMATGLARITGIVEQLRSFAEDGSEAGCSEVVDLNAEVSRLVELVQGASAEKLQVQCKLSPVPFVNVPVRNLRQVLLNLLTPCAQEVGELRKLILRTGRQDGHVVLDLLDPSSQMSEEELGRLFDPFYQPRDDQQLGGLGLSAAYGLARTLGGSLRAFHQPDGGVCIQLALPAVKETGAYEGEQAR